MVPARRDGFGREHIRLTIDDVRKVTSLPRGVVVEVNNDRRGSSTPIATGLSGNWTTVRSAIAEAWVRYQNFWHAPKVKILPKPVDAELPTALPAPVTYGATLDGVAMTVYPGLYLQRIRQGKYCPEEINWTISWFPSLEEATRATAETRSLAVFARENAGAVKEVTISRRGERNKPCINDRRIDDTSSFGLTPDEFWNTLMELVEKNGKGSIAFVYYEGDNPLLIGLNRISLEDVSGETAHVLSRYRAELEDACITVQGMYEQRLGALIAKYGELFDNPSRRVPRQISAKWVKGGTYLNPDKGYDMVQFESPEEVEARIASGRKIFALTEGEAEIRAMKEELETSAWRMEQNAQKTLKAGLGLLQMKVLPSPI